tara:strand:- start:179 stop:1183 length:1005 start_codon:yes stop_codon:yes gene_type:complete
MSQNDFTLANQGFPSMRADMNSAFQALASNNSGSSAPSTTFPHQWWYDTTNSKLMIRNAGNTAFEEFSSGGGGVAYVAKSANYTAEAGEGVVANTASSSWTLTLPASPNEGDVVVIVDGGNSTNWNDNNLIVNRNNSTIEGNSSNLVLSVGGSAVTLIYTSNDWRKLTQTKEVSTTGYTSTQSVASSGFFTLTGIPKGVKTINVILRNLSHSATSAILARVQLVTSSATIGSGSYNSLSTDSSSTSTYAATNAFALPAYGGHHNLSGVLTLTRSSPNWNDWVASGVFANAGTTNKRTFTCAGTGTTGFSEDVVGLEFSFASGYTSGEVSISYSY